MTENRTQKSIFIIIASILMGGIIFLAGLDTFLNIPLLTVLWFAVGFGATALAHLISLIVCLITEKDILTALRMLRPAVLTLISVLWACHENHGFMGNIGAAVIEAFLIIPLAATFLFWLTHTIIRALRSRSNPASK